MNIQELKLQNLGIDKEKYGKTYTFVDFGNVNHWYSKDERDADGNLLAKGQRLIVDIRKLSEFLSLFSEKKRFYYGWHKRMPRSWHILISAERNGFVKITKPIQYVRHYLSAVELKHQSKAILEDDIGQYVEIPKSNFDVEISVDTIRLADEYDTLCLLSGDSDFANLAAYLKRNKRKKIIVIASGKVFHTLKEIADLYINAQQIKADITSVK
jgi:uncharacterized LabA/DUF88 family protein